ncbi:histone deacetylase [Methanonatronarchaeum sp. AMET-Sl]|uniref:histone deacetylase family protein n=1 Tax=Methanonatronarchaeum sp. AMET-Sl TaxID=3037654 RepID=UPI00244DD20C|nr:histone deacetylase [Methanonatronarchaeum sp. AMET-Sl]WGI18163.1 histone deacetylase [Methanonatronarchaeum sp. AMET-Sl]
MNLNLAYHPSFLKHNTGENHPENPGRVKSILKSFDENNIWPQITKIKPKKIDEKTLKKVHTSSHINQIKQICKTGGGRIGSDTVVDSSSYEVALTACGALQKLVNEAIQKQKNGLALTRPPGHHALPNKSMGFCIFNSISVAAEHALKKLDKVLILDWDVHHGNGTQKIFYENNRLLYISIHQTPLFPGTGDIKETGKNQGEGYNINIPLPSEMEDPDYNYIMDEIIIPKINQYDPELILISAGYDGHRKDPLANMNLTSNAYYQLTKKTKNTGKPIVIALEGGYNHQALQKSINQTINALLNKNPNKTKTISQTTQKTSKTTKQTTKKLKKIHKIK